MVARDDSHLATGRKFPEELSGFARRDFVVDQVSEYDQASRFVFIHEIAEPFRDRGHSPQRHERTSGALAQFVAKMKIGHRQPAFRLMEKSQPAIENNFSGDERLVRT